MRAETINTSVGFLKNHFVFDESSPHVPEIKAFRFPGLFRPPRVQHFQDKSREPKGRARDLMKKTLCLDGDKISDLLVPPHPHLHTKENAALIIRKKIIKKRRCRQSGEKDTNGVDGCSRVGVEGG